MNQNLPLFKKIIICVLSVFIFALLDNYINGFIDKYLSELNYTSSTTKIIFLVLSLLVFAYMWMRIKVFNKDYFVNTLLAMIVYFIYRQNIIPHSSWSFAILFWEIYFLDIVFLLLIVILKPILKKWWYSVKDIDRNTTIKRNTEVLAKSNIGEHPIDNQEDDKFDYYLDADSLLKRIVENRYQTSKNALVIGLEGKWGQGKTSYLNMFRLAAEDKYKNEVIVTRFNPWLNHNYNQLVQNFLRSITKGIGDISIINTIGSYEKTIIDADISWISKMTSLATADKSQYADELFAEVSDLIGALDKLLIVQIDDIDRLSKEEVFNTLKLIRNVANFKNTVFIVAYDDNYILDSLKSMDIDKEYLEKIFNMPYSLPITRKHNLDNVIKNHIKNGLLLKKYQLIIVDIFFEIIQGGITLRNAKRLVQSVQNGWLNLLDGEKELMIDLLDYILITYLNEINPTAYRYLSHFKIDNNFISQEKMNKTLIIASGDSLILNMRKNYSDKDFLNEDEYKKNRLATTIGKNG